MLPVSVNLHSLSLRPVPKAVAPGRPQARHLKAAAAIRPQWAPCTCMGGCNRKLTSPKIIAVREPCSMHLQRHGRLMMVRLVAADLPAQHHCTGCSALQRCRTMGLQAANH